MYVFENDFFIQYLLTPSACRKWPNPAHRLFSRLLLKSLIMSERKSRRTSISSELGAQFFNNVATTLRITDTTCVQTETERSPLSVSFNEINHIYEKGKDAYLDSESSQWNQVQDEVCEPPGCTPVLSESRAGSRVNMWDILYQYQSVV